MHILLLNVSSYMIYVDEIWVWKMVVCCYVMFCSTSCLSSWNNCGKTTRLSTLIWRLNIIDLTGSEFFFFFFGLGLNVWGAPRLLVILCWFHFLTYSKPGNYERFRGMHSPLSYHAVCECQNSTVSQNHTLLWVQYYLDKLLKRMNVSWLKYCRTYHINLSWWLLKSARINK